MANRIRRAIQMRLTRPKRRRMGAAMTVDALESRVYLSAEASFDASWLGVEPTLQGDAFFEHSGQALDRWSKIELIGGLETVGALTGDFGDLKQPENDWFASSLVSGDEAFDVGLVDQQLEPDWFGIGGPDAEWLRGEFDVPGRVRFNDLTPTPFDFPHLDHNQLALDSEGVHIAILDLRLEDPHQAPDRFAELPDADAKSGYEDAASDGLIQSDSHDSPDLALKPVEFLDTSMIDFNFAPQNGLDEVGHAQFGSAVLTGPINLAPNDHEVQAPADAGIDVHFRDTGLPTDIEERVAAALVELINASSAGDAAAEEVAVSHLATLLNDAVPDASQASQEHVAAIGEDGGDSHEGAEGTGGSRVAATETSGTITPLREVAAGQVSRVNLDQIRRESSAQQVRRGPSVPQGSSSAGTVAGRPRAMVEGANTPETVPVPLPDGSTVEVEPIVTAGQPTVAELIAAIRQMHADPSTIPPANVSYSSHQSDGLKLKTRSSEGSSSAEIAPGEEVAVEAKTEAQASVAPWLVFGIAVGIATRSWRVARSRPERECDQLLFLPKQRDTTVEDLSDHRR